MPLEPIFPLQAAFCNFCNTAIKSSNVFKATGAFVCKRTTRASGRESPPPSNLASHPDCGAMAHFRHFESGGDNVKVNPCPGSIKVTTHFFLAPTEAGERMTEPTPPPPNPRPLFCSQTSASGSRGWRR